MPQDFQKLYKLIDEIQSLKTESSNPLTENLSFLAQEDLAAALQSIGGVEIRSTRRFLTDHLSRVSARFRTFTQDAEKDSRRIFLVGAGASGRMTLFVKRALMALCPDHPITQRMEAVIAGGDAALIHAVPGFEDDPAMAELQLEKQNFKPGDAVLGFSASGRAPFVLAALRYAHVRGGQSLLIHTNPEHAIRSECEALSLYTESPAVTGSTRLSPTSQMMMACGVFVAMAIGLDTPAAIESFLGKNIETLENLLSGFPFAACAQLVCREAAHLEEGGRMLYTIEAPTFAEQIIFHDLTERTPTAGFFPLKPLPEWESAVDQIPFAYPVFLQAKDTTQVWERLLGSTAPFCLSLPSAPETFREALFSFDFSVGNQTAWESFLKAKGHKMAFLNIRLSEGAMSLGLNQQSSLREGCEDLHPYFQAIFLKMILNTYSTGLMAKLGLIYKNQMSHLLPTNEKLIARSVLQIEERLLEENKSRPRTRILQALLDQLTPPHTLPGALKLGFVEATYQILRASL